ncbi:uncharacterized protein OCT59_001350 [Rhizophagus irregularis]|uniref:uncharacterized protein n=1 Tax=Rhizophagus irregularis TaxID=588596 RepID=UPI0033189691|nr:hypothetical protein OCT59_001350 [Rhizophagus irregularis]
MALILSSVIDECYIWHALIIHDLMNAHCYIKLEITHHTITFQINAKAASKIWQMLSEDKKEQRKQPNCFILFRRDLTAHFQI